MYFTFSTIEMSNESKKELSNVTTSGEIKETSPIIIEKFNNVAPPNYTILTVEFCNARIVTHIVKTKIYKGEHGEDIFNRIFNMIKPFIPNIPYFYNDFEYKESFIIEVSDNNCLICSKDDYCSNTCTTEFVETKLSVIYTM